MVYLIAIGLVLAFIFFVSLTKKQKPEINIMQKNNEAKMVQKQIEELDRVIDKVKNNK